MRVSQNLDFFAIALSEFIYCPFPFLFLGPFTLATFAFYILSACPKKLGVNHGQSLETGP